MKNLEIEKEKIRLKEQSELLSSQKTQNVYTSSSAASDAQQTYQNNMNSLKENIELDDIRLNQSTKSNKQKYIIFGFALVLLFLITIITIRVFTQEENKGDFISQNNTLENLDTKIQQTNNDTLDIDKIVKLEEKHKDEEETKKYIEPKKDNIFDLPTSQKIVKKPILEKKTTKVDTQEDMLNSIKKDLLAKEAKKIKKIGNVIKKDTKVPANNIFIAPSKNNIIKKVKEKVIHKEPIVNKLTKLINNNDYYIQVGAFTQNFNQSLKDSLAKNKYSYTLHKITIKDKLFTKVLVGPYKTREDATKLLDKVRIASKNPKAYVLRLK